MALLYLFFSKIANLILLYRPAIPRTFRATYFMKVPLISLSIRLSPIKKGARRTLLQRPNGMFPDTFVSLPGGKDQVYFVFSTSAIFSQLPVKSEKFSPSSEVRLCFPRCRRRRQKLLCVRLDNLHLQLHQLWRLRSEAVYQE